MWNLLTHRRGFIALSVFESFCSWHNFKYEKRKTDVNYQLKAVSLGEYI